MSKRKSSQHKSQWTILLVIGAVMMVVCVIVAVNATHALLAPTDGMLRGRIETVAQQQDHFVLSLGADAGVENGMLFIAEVQGQPVAKLLVTGVRDGFCMARPTDPPLARLSVGIR